MDGSAFCVR